MMNCLLFVWVTLSGISYAHHQEESRVQLLAGIIKPPFIIEENGKGLQLDIIRSAFEMVDVKVDFIHMPLARQLDSYKRLHLDGIITLPQPTGSEKEAFHYSEPYILYHNVAVSLSERGFAINEIPDLANKHVSAFQNAKRFLGNSYQETLPNMSAYREVADQYKQVRELFQGSVEVIVMDEHIFNHFMRTHNTGIYKKAATIHNIFPHRPYSIGFRNEEMKVKFSMGLSVLMQTGRYQEILDKYL